MISYSGLLVNILLEKRKKLPRPHATVLYAAICKKRSCDLPITKNGTLRSSHHTIDAAYDAVLQRKYSIIKSSKCKDGNINNFYPKKLLKREKMQKNKLF